MILPPPAGTGPAPGPAPARAYLPADLDLSFIAPGRRDAARYFVGRLYLARHVAGNDPDKFLTMYSPLLQAQLGSDYRREVIDPLLEQGVVEADPSYSTGWRGLPSYSKSYRLAPVYRHGRFEAVLLKNPELLRRLARDRAARDVELDAPVHRHLKGWHDRLTVTENYPVVSLPLQALADGERRFEPCRQGRLHTNLTNLARGFRRFVRLDGVEEPLWAVDIKTSQPLLLGLVLQDLDRVEQDEEYVRYAEDRADRWELKRREKRGRSTLSTRVWASTASRSPSPRGGGPSRTPRRRGG